MNKTVAKPGPELLEIGGKAIYEFRSHPRKAPWDKAADETRAAYRARMQELLNVLATEGYKVRRKAG
ncbi:MAG: hypothetical protein K1X51_17315 [Rhodospirillaceae bacterium]|nr:hypothetical protein [Rhodospirillaceae bacterium]